jgi:sigma-B regulation protein RsbU (phosphoserine phosphatase)
MLGIAPELSSQQVLQAFHHDEPYLFLGAAFSTVGLLALASPLVRRKFDPLFVYFGIFAVLYGQRLWIQSEVLALTIPRSDLFLRLRSVIDFTVPIPAVLFLSAGGFLRSWIDRVAGYGLLVESVVLAILTAIRGPSDTYHLINNIFVIAAMLALAIRFTRQRDAGRDFNIVRIGLFIFIALALWDNVGGILSLRLFRAEPLGFAVLLGTLGYVAARRSLERDQQLREIQSELEVARRIQQSILPAQFPKSCYFQVAARYVPMTSVAGDFYDFVVSDGPEAGLLIADVSGHGVPAALIASMVKLAASSQRDVAADPSRFLSGMNAALYGNTQNQFVTAAYVHLNADSSELRYSAAGHPPMLLLRNGSVSEVMENGLMLAIFDSAGYTTATRQLERGDRLLLYTDGLVEATNAAGDFFGNASLRYCFQQTAKLPADQAADFILSSVQRWSASQDDDLTLLVCDYVPNPA